MIGPMPDHPSQPDDSASAGPQSVLGALPEYQALLRGLLDGPPAPAQAPVPAGLAERARNLQASALFMDAALAGVCQLDDGEGPPGHGHALVLAVPWGREPLHDEPGAAWVQGTQAAVADLRCTEIAAVLAGYLRALGWPAQGHVAGATPLDLPALAQRAGLPLQHRGRLLRLGVVSTAFEMAAGVPPAVAPAPPAPEPAAPRPLHAGHWPMELVPRVGQPTTGVWPEQIQRVPKRADLFTRALAGDLGPRAQAERSRFAVKHPLAAAMVPLIRALVPLQGTREPLAPTGFGGDLGNPAQNTLRVKALAHHLGAELVGVCEAQPWMYYSHDEQQGAPIEPYHRWAVVMLVDQGFHTMQGASGDDWISGAQSMRGYLHGALMAGVLAAHLRRCGHSARVHSNAHSELLHLPALLMAGLGELSRIGELVLNPFIGPRSKSVLVTTSLPLQPDQPIDFGLQAYCQACRLCARECPCNAIPYGPKVVFNGYEIWKPDVHKCGQYRLTNMKGSACGRCMKTCPFNREVPPQWPLPAPAADDTTGRRHPDQRWWWDLEVVNGVAQDPLAGTNERDPSPGRDDKLAAAQKIAVFPPALQPAGGTTMDTVVPMERAAGLAAAQGLRPPPTA